MSDLKAALSQIQLLTDNERVLLSAESLTGKINRTRRLVRDVKLANPDEDPANDPTVQSAVRETDAYRLSFIADAREDLGYSSSAP